MVFEIEIRRVYEFHSALIFKKPLDMSDKVAKFEKAIRKAVLGSSNQTVSVGVRLKQERLLKQEVLEMCLKFFNWVFCI